MKWLHKLHAPLKPVTETKKNKEDYLRGACSMQQEMENMSNILVRIPTFSPYEVLINKTCSTYLPKEHTEKLHTFKYV
jgi:hypothetical protein